jgi:hypothetical protein
MSPLSTRRTVLRSASALLGVSLAGCLGDGDDPGSSTSTETPTHSPSPTEQARTPDEATKERVIECERRYIRREYVDDDETLGDGLDPEISETETREEGLYVSVFTGFGTMKEGAEGEPSVHMDYEVRAYYLVTDEAMYRTEERGEDPREGTELDC